MSERECVPPEAWAVALSSLPAMGPGRLLAFLRTWPPREGWQRVLDRSWTAAPAVARACGSGAEQLTSTWARAASATDVEGLWRRCGRLGIGVAALASAAYPTAFAEDIEPPGVLFTLGDPAAVAGPRVAIVGTRAASHYGRGVAHEFGQALSSAGVSVVSGLAVGIDGAAHAGALAAGVAPPIAVVGSGLDVVYPRRHRELWERVAQAGVVLGEAPPGAPPERWRFPARNRLIAALADAVVVVESGAQGGSMHTVTEAQRRDRPVFAVPGPVRSRSSAGTNRLLRDGALAACDVDDVLVVLGMARALDRSVRERRPPVDETGQQVLDALGWQPASLEQLALRVPVPLGRLSVALVRLCADGWVAERGGWYEQVARSEGGR